jgi:hypothetical protein
MAGTARHKKEIKLILRFLTSSPALIVSAALSFAVAQGYPFSATALWTMWVLDIITNSIS